MGDPMTRLTRRFRLRIACAVVLAACACDDAHEGGKSEVAAKDESAKAESAKAEPAKAEPTGEGGDEERRAARAEKDEGSLSVKIGDAVWSTDKARARLTGKRLGISANRTQRTDAGVDVQRLSLSLSDYEGPGDYDTGITGSTFVRAGFDAEAAAAAEDDDSKAAKLAADTIRDSSVVMLSHAKVRITAADDTFIEGTFEWTPPAGNDGPPMRDGTFRARIAEPRQKK
jgi:hypothetical protein